MPHLLPARCALLSRVLRQHQRSSSHLATTSKTYHSCHRMAYRKAPRNSTFAVEVSIATTALSFGLASSRHAESGAGTLLHSLETLLTVRVSGTRRHERSPSSASWSYASSMTRLSAPVASPVPNSRRLASSATMDSPTSQAGPCARHGFPPGYAVAPPARPRRRSSLQERTSSAMRYASSPDTSLRARTSLAICARRDFACTEAAWLRIRCR